VTSLGSEKSRSAEGNRLLSIAALLALIALTGGLRLVYLAASKPLLDVEASPVAQVFALSQGESVPGDRSGGASPLGSLQLAGYTFLTRAFERHPPITAVREAVVAASIAGAALLWILARRLGMPSWAATSAVILLAVSPLAIGLQRVVLVEDLAVVCALAALVLICSPRRNPPLVQDLLVAVLLLLAVLTSPLALALVPTAAWLMVRHREPVRVVATAVAFELGLGIALGPAAGALRPDLAGLNNAGIGDWLTRDPVLLAIAGIAALLSFLVATLRPIGLGVLLVSGVLLWPGAPRPGVLAMLLPLATLLVAGVLHAGQARTRPTGRHWVGHRGYSTPMAIGVWVMVASITASWVQGFDRLSVDQRASPPLTEANKWLRENASGARLLTDDAGWVELAATGWPSGALVLPSACATVCPPLAWVLTTPAMLAQRRRFPAVDGLLARAQPAAGFGSPGDRVEIFRLPAAPATPVLTDEQSARARAGTMLASSPRITAEGETVMFLWQGRVDPRLLSTIASFASRQPVRIVALPGFAGEDAADQPRRQALLAGAPGPLTRFFQGQRDVYRPASVTAVPSVGVLVAYPPFPPVGLLAAFQPP
jgi:hypothetical protein